MKKIVLISLGTLYCLGIISSIVTLNTKNQATKINQGNSFISKISDKKSNVIGVINIDGPIFFDQESGGSITSAFSQSKGANHWLHQLNSAATNENIKAVILRMNTPGGTVGASQELYHAVARIQKQGKPVVASVSDMSASGGYYMTAGVDHMFVNGGSLIGSIGVIISGIEYSELMKKLGLSANVIKSGANKDILSPYEQLSSEQRTILQEVIMDTYNQFVNVVQTGRNLPQNQLSTLADGRIFSGNQAVQNGLADKVGTFYDAVAYVKERYSLSDAEVAPVSVAEGGFSLNQLFMKNNNNPKIEVALPHSLSLNSPILYLYQF